MLTNSLQLLLFVLTNLINQNCVGGIYLRFWTEKCDLQSAFATELCDICMSTRLCYVTQLFATYI